MKHCIMAIYDKEEEYAVRLMEYLNQRRGFPYQVSIFSNRESLEEYQKHYKVDLLLVGEDCAYRGESGNNIAGRICILREGPEGECNYPSINKYQSAEQILYHIEALDPQVGGFITDHTEKAQAKISVVLSADKAKERADTARELAIQGNGEQNLYIPMELFPQEGTEDCREKGLSDFIYYLKKENPQEWLKENLSLFIRRQGSFNEISPIHCSMDLQELRVEDMRVMLEVLCNNTGMRNLIFDVGYFNESLIELCRCCDEIYMVTEEICNPAEEFYIRQLVQMCGETIKEKITYIRR